MQINREGWFDAFIYACIAILGGISRELSNPREHTFFSFLSGAIISVFSGLLMFCICKNYNVNEFMTAAAVGLSGFLGIELIRVLANMLKKKTNGL